MRTFNLSPEQRSRLVVSRANRISALAECRATTRLSELPWPGAEGNLFRFRIIITWPRTPIACGALCFVKLPPNEEPWWVCHEPGLPTGHASQ